MTTVIMRMVKKAMRTLILAMRMVRMVMRLLTMK